MASRPVNILLLFNKNHPVIAVAGKMLVEKLMLKTTTPDEKMGRHQIIRKVNLKLVSLESFQTLELVSFELD